MVISQLNPFLTADALVKDSRERFLQAERQFETMKIHNAAFNNVLKDYTELIKKQRKLSEGITPPDQRKRLQSKLMATLSQMEENIGSGQLYDGLLQLGELVKQIPWVRTPEDEIRLTERMAAFCANISKYIDYVLEQMEPITKAFKKMRVF